MCLIAHVIITEYVTKYEINKLIELNAYVIVM